MLCCCFLVRISARTCGLSRRASAGVYGGGKASSIDHRQSYGNRHTAPRAARTLGLELGGGFAAGPDLRSLRRAYGAGLPRLLGSAVPSSAGPASPSFAARPVWRAASDASTVSLAPVARHEEVRCLPVNPLLNNTVFSSADVPGTACEVVSGALR